MEDNIKDLSHWYTTYKYDPEEDFDGLKDGIEEELYDDFLENEYTHVKVGKYLYKVDITLLGNSCIINLILL